MTTARTAGITSFIVMDVLEKAHEMEREGVDVVHLEIGEPDFDMPQCIKAAACQALDAGYTHYTHSLGLLELRQVICEYYTRTYRVNIDPEQVLVTSGSSPAIFMLFSALVEPGEEVIISDPHYACYPNFFCVLCAPIELRLLRASWLREFLQFASLKGGLCGGGPLARSRQYTQNPKIFTFSITQQISNKIQPKQPAGFIYNTLHHTHPNQ